MISKAQVIRNHSEYKTLINAVINSLGGTESIEDVNSHGIDGGYGQFVYYSDTHRFAMRYRKLIVRLLEELADDLGEDVVTMVSAFGVFRRDGMDKEDKKDLYKYLGGGRNEQSAVTNVMAWFAAESVCRWFKED